MSCADVDELVAPEPAGGANEAPLPLPAKAVLLPALPMVLPLAAIPCHVPLSAPAEDDTASIGMLPAKLPSPPLLLRPWLLPLPPASELASALLIWPLAWLLVCVLPLSSPKRVLLSSAPPSLTPGLPSVAPVRLAPSPLRWRRASGEVSSDGGAIAAAELDVGLP